MDKIMCFFGFHKWAFGLYFAKYGMRCGDRCTRCKRWSKTSLSQKYPDEIEKEEYWF